MSQGILLSQRKPIKLWELPEEFKMYNVELTNGSKYLVSGDIRINILNSKTDFVELQDGSTIKKAFIIEFKFNPDETRDYALENKKKLGL